MPTRGAGTDIPRIMSSNSDYHVFQRPTQKGPSMNPRSTVARGLTMTDRRRMLLDAQTSKSSRCAQAFLCTFRSCNERTTRHSKTDQSHMPRYLFWSARRCTSPSGGHARCDAHTLVTEHTWHEEGQSELSPVHTRCRYLRLIMYIMSSAVCRGFHWDCPGTAAPAQLRDVRRDPDHSGSRHFRERSTRYGRLVVSRHPLPSGPARPNTLRLRLRY